MFVDYSEKFGSYVQFILIKAVSIVYLCSGSYEREIKREGKFCLRNVRRDYKSLVKLIFCEIKWRSRFLKMMCGYVRQLWESWLNVQC